MMNRLSVAFFLASAACGGSIDIDVHIVDPCNQDAVQMMQYLKLEPRGDGIDSAGLSTIVDVESGSSGQPIPLPLASDFHLVASGYADDTFDNVLGIGVSAKRDLTNADQAVEVRVPFALVDNFYKTTALDDSGECTHMVKGRYGATATFLPDSGKVLIVGGANLEMDMGVPVLQYIRAIELYDPGTGAFNDVGELRSGGARAFHTATLLADGRVLIAGGEAHVQSTKEALKSALLIDASDPGKVVVSEQGIVMRQARTGHTAMRLSDGRVLLAGGRVLSTSSNAPEDQQYLTSVEIFDPALEAFTTPVDDANNPAEMHTARYGHSGFTLKSGFDVAVLGGMNSTGPVLNAEVMHFEANKMTVKTSSVTIGVGPIFHAGDINDRGEILVSGGYSTIADAEPASGVPLNPSAMVEMYAFDNSAMELRRVCVSSMSTPRGFHTASIIGRNAIVIGGRGDDGLPLPSSETALLVSGVSCFGGRPAVVHNMTDARAQHAVAKMQMSGELLVVGGRQQAMAEPFGRSIDSAEVFSPKREP